MSIGLHYVILPFPLMCTPMQNHEYLITYITYWHFFFNKFLKPILSKTFYHKVLLHLPITKEKKQCLFTICQGEWAQLVIETIKSKSVYCTCSWHQWPFMPRMIFRIVCRNVYHHHHEWNSFIIIHFSFTMYEFFSLPSISHP